VGFRPIMTLSPRAIWKSTTARSTVTLALVYIVRFVYVYAFTYLGSI